MENMPGNNDSRAKPAGAGLRVGEWLLTDRVGGGAFGEVYRARHHVWADQLAAVKLPTDPQYVRALQREGTHAHRLEHPNVVRPLGFDPFAQTPYLVMEYVPGRDLRPAPPRGRHDDRRRRDGGAAGRAVGPATRPRQRHRPPRHQAGKHPPARERPGDAGRPGTGGRGEGHGLRPRAGQQRRRAGQRHAEHRVQHGHGRRRDERPGGRVAGLHGPRTAGRRAAGGRAGGPLRLRRGAVRDAHRRAAGGHGRAERPGQGRAGPPGRGVPAELRAAGEAVRRRRRVPWRP